MLIKQRITTVLFVVFVSACSANPVTGQREFTLMSTAQEVQTGEQYYHSYQQQEGGLYVVDPEVNLYVDQVGQRLAEVSDRPELPYEFVVLNNNTPNAWALPGGKIAINRGLLVMLEDEAQLAAVLGHEIVHAAARHSARQHTQATLLSASMLALGAAAQQTDYGHWISAGAGLGANVWLARYSREQELEADEFGVEYMAEAGYEPEAAVELQQTFLKLSEGRQAGFMENLFASHPPSQVRVERNRELASQLPQGQRDAEGYERAIRQILQDQPAYEAQEKALAAAHQNDLDGALDLVDEAIRLQPKEANFTITRGQILMAQENYASAEEAFQQAVRLNPDYFLGHIGVGLTAKAQNQTSTAERAFKTSMDILPTPLASYHLGELALATGQRDDARSYFEAAAQGSGEIAQAAQEQLARMGG